MLAQNRFVQRLSGGALEHCVSGSISWMQMQFLKTNKDPAVLKKIRQVRKEKRGGPLANESFLIHSIAHAQRKLDGDYAEVGVFRGGSARVICEAKGDKRLHLFDTFEGLPEGAAQDGGVLRKHQYACDLPSVQSYLADFPNLSYPPGLFPDSTQDQPELAATRFAFVHCDVDLYEGTKACLEFFYPRLVRGGILVSHDYSVFRGVKLAFDEFLADKIECAIEMPTTQCMLVKA